MGTDRRKRPARRGFTLIELLVVVLIVSIVGVATIKVAIFDQGGRHISEAARVLQAALVGARDAAFRANAPRGIRLLPDPVFNGQTGGALAANRMISIETAPDYNTGLVTVSSSAVVATGSFLVIFESMVTPVTNATTVQVPNEPTSWYWNIRQGDKIRFGDSGRYYTVAGPNLSGAYVPDPNNAGQYIPYNVERYVNFGPPGNVMSTVTNTSVVNDPNPLNYYDPSLQPKGGHFPEFLQVVNGQDDDGDGWVDEGFDGIDNDGDGIIDPGFNGIDDDGVNGVDDPAELTYSANGGGVYNGGEYEPEAFVGNEFNALNVPGQTTDKVYTIVRRPIVSEGAREVALPQGVVIDLTTWNATGARKADGSALQPTLPERSRLPVDPYSHFADIMLSPDGQVMTSGAGQSAGSLAGGMSSFPTSNMPFYHFWIAEREDVYDPMFGTIAASAKTPATQVPKANPKYGSTPPQTYLLPMPQGAVGTWISPTNGAATSVPYTAFDASGNVSPNGPFLKGDSRLVTLFVKTGHVLTYDIGLSDFDPTDTNQPYMQAQFGVREAK